jgi:predicted hotdog family 3-hydroxylacyl-ACP dehydratase
MAHFTYEAFLDEVTTLLTELYELDDDAAIKLVVDAQENSFFSLHDDMPEMCTIERAREDAIALFEAKQSKQQTQKKQQQRWLQKKKLK